MKKCRVQYLACVLLIMFGCSSPEKKSSTEAEQGIVTLTPEAFKDELSSVPNAVIIDVRTPAEVQEGMIQGAVNLDIKDSTFTGKLRELDKNNAYFVYCKAGTRSDVAAKQMEEMGFKNIRVLEGGMMEWKAKGLETVEP
jgi:rhodanese-related sulfurtransferase